MKKIIAIALSLVLALSLFAGCNKSDDKTITVGATASPHAEILEVIKDALAADGWTLVIKEFNDYVLPNTAVEEGQLDANYFQHIKYLNNFNVENGTHLVSVAGIHYEPMGIYAGTSTSLSELPEGAKIAVPNDATNEARALLLLEKAGLIKLKEGVGIAATKDDIVEYHRNIELYEVQAELVPTVLKDVAIAVINGNYAIDAGLKLADALATEDKNDESTDYYQNVLVVKEGNENSEKIQALVKALKSETVKNFINEKYNGAVVPLF